MSHLKQNIKNPDFTILLQCRVLLYKQQKNKLPKIYLWCRRWDLNPHELSLTAP